MEFRACLPPSGNYGGQEQKNEWLKALHKKEYLEWITEAKGAKTRKRRLATAIEWMAEGKSRHWKYLKC